MIDDLIERATAMYILAWWVDAAAMCEPTIPAVYRAPPLLEAVPILVQVRRVPAVPSEYTGTIPAAGTTDTGTILALPYSNAPPNIEIRQINKHFTHRISPHYLSRAIHAADFPPPPAPNTPFLPPSPL